MAGRSNAKDDFYVEGDELIREADETEEALQPETDEQNSEETEQETKKGSGFKKFLKALIIVFAVVIAISGAGVAVLMNMPQNVVFDGIKCEGMDLGNMTYEQALSALQSKMDVNIEKITVSVNYKTYDISADTIALAPLAEETAKKVFAYGKDNNTLINAYRALKLKFNGVDILPVTTLNEEALKQELVRIGNDALGTLTPYTVEMNGIAAVLKAGKRGFDLNTDKAVKEIKESISQDIYDNISLTMKIGDPQMLTVEEVEKTINVPATNATYTLTDGKVVITPEKAGVQIDKTACQTAIGQLNVESEPISVPCISVPAEKTAETLKSKMFNYILGTYTTSYAAGGNRGSNVANAARRINGYVILPGQTFSFNNVVGRRSVANGFKPAPEYQNGSTVTGIGGGTCQVSTTLYSAVLYSGLKVDSRRNHSMSVSYVPLGQDATVTDGGIDFKFTNDTEYPVKIETITSGGKLTVKLIGTKPDIERKIKITHTNIGGSSVKTTRTVYDMSGNVIKTDNMGVSKYKPH